MSAAFRPYLVRYCHASARNHVMSDPNPPPGFEPLFRTSPFLETVGPLFYRRDAKQGLIIGLRIDRKHANARGTAHRSKTRKSPGPRAWRSVADARRHRAGLSDSVQPGPARWPHHGEPDRR